MELFLSTKVLKMTCECVQIAFMSTTKRWGGQCWVLHPFCEKSACWSQTNTHTVLCDWELSCEELSTGRDVVNLPET